MKRPPFERWISKVIFPGDPEDQSAGCWVWNAAKGGSNNQYGVFWDGERITYAHRFAYRHYVGPIPPDLELDHFACDNPICCNPSHVRLVTPRENLLRSNGAIAMRVLTTHCVRGHELSGDNISKTEYRTRRKRVCLLCARARWPAKMARIRARAAGGVARQGTSGDLSA